MRSLYTNFLRLGIFLTALYAYFFIHPIIGFFIFGTGIFTFLFRLRSFILLSESLAADYWEMGITLLFLLNGFALALNLYNNASLYSIDIPMHMLGGICVSWWGALVFKKDLLSSRALKQFILIIAIAALFGVGWEIFEWSFDHTIGARYHLPPAQPSNDDTMKDLVDDIIGGIIVSLFAIKQKERA